MLIENSTLSVWKLILEIVFAVLPQVWPLPLLLSRRASRPAVSGLASARSRRDPENMILRMAHWWFITRITAGTETRLFPTLKSMLWSTGRRGGLLAEVMPSSRSTSVQGPRSPGGVPSADDRCRKRAVVVPRTVNSLEALAIPQRDTEMAPS